MNHKFSHSAGHAAQLLARLFEQAGQDSGRIAAPQLLELLTLCRETGLRVPLLEVFAKVVDEAPVLTVIGGDSQLVTDLARCIGLPAEIQDVSETPLLWWIEPGDEKVTRIHVGSTEREISDAALHALLSSPLPPDRVTVLHREVACASPWRLAWLPDAEALALHAGWPAVLEALVGAHVLVAVGDEMPPPFQSWMTRPGMIVKQFAATEIVREDVRPLLFSQLCTLREISYEEVQAVHAATWHFVLPRLVDQLDSLRQQYSLEIDRQNRRLQITRQTLGEYRRNWSGGLRNELDDFFSKKTTGPAMAALLDPRQPGPQSSTYLQALAVPALAKRLTELFTDRMAEFVQGLGALAVRVELRTISLKEIEMRWSQSGLGAQIEEELDAKRIFSEGGGQRAGLVGSLMGKNEEIATARRAQLARANKIVQQIIEQDFLHWCDRVMHAVEQRVRVQISAAQANQGLPDVEALRAGLTGIDRLTEMLETNRDGLRDDPPKVAAQILKGWSQRRWFRRFTTAT